jgi:hypothetical protein
MKAALALVIVLATAFAVQAVTIDVVTVGNPGNAPDTQIMTTNGTTGFGSVVLAYRSSRLAASNATVCRIRVTTR